MKEIKVGEYVRTKKKGIFRVLSIKKTAYGYLCGTTDNEHIPTFTIGKGGNAEIKNIVRHSPNPIDLIEVGDYVNGERISNTDRINNTIFLEWDNGNKYSTDIVNDKFIISIVTKEQFASVEYRLEE